MPQRFEHDPGDTAPYFVDFGTQGNQVALIGSTITSVTWVVPDGLTKEFQSSDGYICKIILSGGVAGATYTVKCVAVFGSGDEECTLSRSIEIYCVVK